MTATNPSFAARRTALDLLAERRATVQELRRERDAMTRGMLAASVAQLDAEIAAVGK